jgi:hypothetical protein
MDAAMGAAMTDQEINRAVQYVVASTSYGRDTVEQIITTGFAELSAMAATSSTQFDRSTLLEYVCRWTMAKTGQPEPLVREVLGCAGRWLDELYDALLREHPEWQEKPDR